MSASLIARPIPISGESPASVLIRAVEGNGYPNLQALVWALWKNRSGRGWAKASFVDPARFGQIIDQLGIDMSPEEIPAFARSGPTSESARLLDGMEIPEKLFRDDGRYFCPDCLRERRYWRKSWTLRPFSVCPEHHKFLLKDCPNCGRQLHLWRAKLAECECGADLRAASSESADSAILRWWLDGHQRSDPGMHAIDEMLLAITDFDGGDDSLQAENRRLGAVHDWLVRCKVASARIGCQTSSFDTPEDPDAAVPAERTRGNPILGRSDPLVLDAANGLGNATDR